MLAGRVFGWGHDRNTTPEYWIDGRRMRAVSGKGCAVEFSTNGGVFMKSLVFKRSIVIASHKTSVSLEDAFWNGLKEIAASRNMPLSDLVSQIDSQRQHGNLSSAIRLFVLDHYRTLARGGKSEEPSDEFNRPRQAL